MSLFIKSMIWNGWQLAEETKEPLLFTKAGEGSSIWQRLFAPYGGEVRAVLSHERFGEHACSFGSLKPLLTISVKIDFFTQGATSYRFKWNQSGRMR